MALAHLPNELLENIIAYTVPEGFESVAVTCKKFFTLCIPFTQRHNALRSRFHHFTYYFDSYDPSPAIVTAADLIRRIAVEPIVARYIRFANFQRDSPRSFTITPGFIADADCPSYCRAKDHADCRAGCRDDVIRLFASCPYLKEAGLDWKKYLNEIEKELTRTVQLPHYSQHAAAFLLTLLPNVERLILPQSWKSLGGTDKLINAIARKARQVPSHCDMPSLAQITKFEPWVSLVPQDRFDLSLAIPFLTLPRIRSFHGPSCVIMDDSHQGLVPKDSIHGYGETLESIIFTLCCLDELDIMDILRDTKLLKSLRYSHSTKYDTNLQCWEICKFISAIERQVGSHLVELSVSIREPFGSIAPGKVSLRGFTCLRQLEFPLEVVMCNITAAGSQPMTLKNSITGWGSSDQDLNSAPLFIGDLVPASVSVLSLISKGTDHHEKSLDVLFRDFAARKEATLPALTDIHLVCPNSADASYKEHCNDLLVETQKAGVALHLWPWAHGGTLTWYGGEPYHAP